MVGSASAFLHLSARLDFTRQIFLPIGVSVVISAVCSSRLFQAEDGFVVGAVDGTVPEAFVFERSEAGRVGDAVFDDETGHGAAAHLGIHHDGLEPAAFAHHEFGLDASDFLPHTLSVEEAFHLFACHVEQDAAVGLDAVDERVGEQWLPIVEHAKVVMAGQPHITFQPVVLDAVQGTQQTVEERGDPQVLLCEVELASVQRRGIEMLVGDAGVRKDGRSLG